MPNFMGMGPMELIIILVIAILIVGPNKLPEVAASVGRGIRDFNKARQQLTAEVKEELNWEEEKKEFQALKADMTQTFAEPIKEMKTLVQTGQQDLAKQTQEINSMLGGTTAPTRTVRPARPVPAAETAAPTSQVPEQPTARRPVRTSGVHSDARRIRPVQTRRRNLNQP